MAYASSKKPLKVQNNNAQLIILLIRSSQTEKKITKVSPPARSFVRRFNRYNILSAIRTISMISRIDIAKHLDLSKDSLTGNTADLIKEGLILKKKNEHIRSADVQSFLQ
jgi:DNA-binding MarR family transcriptional regulator